MQIPPKQLGPNSRCHECLAMGLKSYNESELVFNFTVAGHPPGRRSLPDEAGPGLSRARRLTESRVPGERRRAGTDGAWWGLRGRQYLAKSLSSHNYYRSLGSLSIRAAVNASTSCDSGPAPASCANGNEANPDLFFPPERRKKEIHVVVSQSV